MLGLACTGLAACSSLSDSLTPSKVDYRAVAEASANKPQSLDVPPDLTQLSSDPRYAPPAGSAISANALTQAAPLSAAQAGGAAAPASTAVAQTTRGEMRIVREGETRWLVTSRTPESVWPQLRQFWLDAGFTLDKDEPTLGYMETGWAENRAKLPHDVVRRTLGRLIDGMYDTGERDRYRTRVERSAQGTEITISHRGAMEVAAGRENEQTRWQMRPSDPALEAEMLARLMAKLSPQQAQDPKATAAAPAMAAASQAVAQASVAPARARVLEGRAASTVQIDDGFDRAWRRVGLALDRGGFTVEDRDRNQGLYFVRYVDPKLAGEEDPNFFQRLFGKRKDELAGTRLRLKIVSSQGGQVSLLETLDVEGQPRNDVLTRGIVQLLAQEMR